MSNYYGKQNSSRLIKFQPLTWLGTGTLFSTNFTDQTYQIRVTTQLPIWINIGVTTSTNDASLPTTVGGIGAYVAANVTGEYFACNPKQLFSFSSTSTSTLGSFGNFVSVTEMS